MPSDIVALTREVSPRIVECELVHIPRSPIDVGVARAQHAAYERLLAELGCEVRRVAAAPDHADSVFVEDTAVVFDELAVITRPGAESRRGELAGVEEALRQLRPLARIEHPATLDGGDVIVAGRNVFVGRTSRTNGDGAGQLRALLAPHGYSVTELEVTACLHLKSAATALDDRTILLNPAWVAESGFAPLKVIAVDPVEPDAANVVRVGAELIYADSYPRTRARLEAEGFRPRVVDASELAKAEGAVTCCSLLVRTIHSTVARWRASWRAIGATTADTEEFAELIARYGEPGRAYHTRRHLDECLALWEPVRSRTARAGEVEIALWYHDAVYDPRRADNEDRSADLAAEAMERAGLDREVIGRVRSLILATRHVAPPAPGDEALLVDLDLGILAGREARFDEYEREIREEYAWVPSIIFSHKRKGILKGFLDRERIYSSGAFTGLEARARANLTRSLSRL